jgi:hypothetical protein
MVYHVFEHSLRLLTAFNPNRSADSLIQIDGEQPAVPLPETALV